MFKKFKQRRKARQNEWLYRQQSMVTSVAYRDSALNSELSGVGNNLENEIIVSFTSFNARINDVYLTVESIFQQSLKADKVILWLSTENFPNKELDLPEILKKQSLRGLDICFVDEDIGAYKKIYYALKKYPNSLILTIDDDILYPLDMIDQLYRAYRVEPTIIHCHRAHRITFDDSGRLLPYLSWVKSVSADQAGLDVFPTGIGGVLYFSGCFDDEVLNKDAFQRMAPNADDIWLKAMSLKKGVCCKPIEDPKHWKSKFLMIEGSQNDSLASLNKSKTSGNDAKLKAVFGYYGLWESFQ